MVIILKSGKEIELTDETGQEVLKRVRKALTSGMKGLVIFHDDVNVNDVIIVLNLEEVAAIVLAK